MDSIKRLVKGLVRYFEGQNLVVVTICGMLIALLMFWLVYEVVMRYFFDSPTNWVVEMSTYVMVAIILLPLAYAEQVKRHTRVDVLVLRLSKQMQTRLGIVTAILGLFFFGLFTWSGFLYAREALETGEIANTSLETPLFPVKVLLPIGGALMSIQLLITLARHIADLRKKGEDDD